MMLDGCYSSETDAAYDVNGVPTAPCRNGTGWSNKSSNWCTGAANTSQCTGNWAMGSTSRGICPQGWHVPTDRDWTDLAFAIEPTYAHNTASMGDWHGANNQDGWGAKLKSACHKCTSGAGCYNNNTVNDNNPLWLDGGTSYRGVDAFGFRLLSAGGRIWEDAQYRYRGTEGAIWTSTAYSNDRVIYRGWYHHKLSVFRNHWRCPGNGQSVRCVRDN